MSKQANGENGEDFQENGAAGADHDGPQPRVAGVATERLVSFVDRIERLEGEIGSLNEDKADCYKAAGDEGFDKSALKIVVRRRRKDHQALETEDYLVDLYERALAGEITAPPQPTDAENAAHAEAREAGRGDGLNDCRDNEHRWPPGEIGHGDYELGWEDGRTERIDREEAERMPPAASRSRARARARERADA